MKKDNFLIHSVIESFEESSGTIPIDEVVRMINLSRELENDFEPVLKFRQKVVAMLARYPDEDEGTQAVLDIVDVGVFFGMIMGAAGLQAEIDETNQNTPMYKRVLSAIRN